MNWFKPKVTQKKRVEAAVTVATNLYLNTIPGAETATVKLHFNLPDSRFRYLLFCLSAMATAIAGEVNDLEAVLDECLRSLATYAVTEGAQQFFDGPVDARDAVNNGTAYLQRYLRDWSKYAELEKEGRDSEIIELSKSPKVLSQVLC